MATSLLKFSLKTNIVKSIFFEVISKVSRYYYTFGRVSPWPTVLDPTDSSVIISGEEDPPAISDTYADELEARKDIVYMKAIDSNDIGLVVRRVNWIPGLVYDMYDDYSSDRVAFSGAQNIAQANFYVLTDDYNVYKCLFNANNTISIEKPRGTDPFPVEYSDGYIWKFMYSIPISLRNKFLNTGYMPVTTSLTNQFYSAGSIVDYVIENRGAKYIKNAWKIKRIVITDGGSGYDVNDITLTFPNAPLGGVTATAEVTLVQDGMIQEITVTNQGSGYVNQPLLEVNSTQGSGFEYVVEYEYDSSAYTKLKVVGDGYNPKNPYTLKSVTVINGGTFAANHPNDPTGQTFLIFPSPQLETGHRPKLQFNWGLKQGTVDQYEIQSVDVLDEGYGYTEPLTVGTNGNTLILQDLVDAGFQCDLNVNSQKNEAELIPLINSEGEIEEIIVQEAGIGYTYASVVIEAKKTITDEFGSALVDITNDTAAPGYVQDFKEANIQLQFGVGDIDTKQSNVELLAVEGAIRIVNIDYAGIGYPSNTTVEIVGDGTGFVCEPVIVNGSFRKINVLNQGSGYTYAEVKITPDYSVDEEGNPIENANLAKLRPIISPKGGHGKDSVSELYCNSLMLVTKLASDKNKGVLATNDYRQVCIVKNPKVYQQDLLYKNAVGSACALFICEKTINNTSTYEDLEQDDTLNFALGSANKTYTLVDKQIIDNKYYLLVQVNGNYIPPAGSTLTKTINASTSLSISVTSVEYPDFNKYSGEMLFVDNRVKFAPSEDQTIVATTLISF